MRSVVVVLPASMWAMIPMFRVFSSVNLRGMRARCVVVACVGGVKALRPKKRGPRGPYVTHGCFPIGGGLCVAALHEQRVQSRGTCRRQALPRKRLRNI